MKIWLHSMAHRFTAAVLAVLLIMSLAVPGLTAAGEEIPSSDNGEGRLIRVAFPEIPGISEVDRYGRHTGLLMDYLNEIAKYTNWEYERTGCRYGFRCVFFVTNRSCGITKEIEYEDLAPFDGASFHGRSSGRFIDNVLGRPRPHCGGGGDPVI